MYYYLFMKYLITGSEGNIGSSLKDVFAEEKNEDYACIDIFHKNEANYKRCDISNIRQIRKVLDLFEPKIVINLAGEFGRWNGEDYYENLWQTNAIGVKNFLELQKEYKFRFVHASSSEVYGDYKGIMTEEIMEEVPIRQMNDYAISKWVNEMQISNSVLMNGTESVIFRIFNTYGPGETFNEYRSALSRFIFSILMDLPYKVYSGHIRTHTYIKDCARMIKIIADIGKSGEAYNVAGPDKTSMEEINEMICKIANKPFKKEFLESKNEPFTTKEKLVSNSKFMNLVNKEFKFTPLKQGLENTIEWYRDLLSE